MKNIKLLFCTSLISEMLLNGSCLVPFENEPGFSQTQISINSQISSIKGDNYIDVGSQSENVYVLFFSTTWCHNCPKVAQSLSILADTISARFSNSNIKFLYIIIGNESNKDVEKHFHDLNIKNVEVCRAMPYTNFSGIECIPSCIVFDKHGKQVFRYDGQVEYNCDEFKNFLTNLANKDNNKSISKNVTTSTKRYTK